MVGVIQGVLLCIDSTSTQERYTNNSSTCSRSVQYMFAVNENQFCVLCVLHRAISDTTTNDRRLHVVLTPDTNRIEYCMLCDMTSILNIYNAISGHFFLEAGSSRNGR